MKIVSKTILSEVDNTRVIKLDILSPDIAQKTRAGQFVALMVSERGERIPLTLVDANKEKGIISLIFQEAGLTTRLLGKMNVEDSLYSLVGPLGHATELKKYGKIIIVAGGVGVAEIYPVAKALKQAGNYVEVIIGTRTKDLLILEEELKAASDQLYITTDDGSYGRKAFTTDILHELLIKQKYDLVYSVGPIPMMKRSVEVVADQDVRIIVSLNALMVDATGMCGCCRVTVAGQTKFSCVDGPEFDGREIDWDELTKRNKIYIKQEQHVCKLLDE